MAMKRDRVAKCLLNAHAIDIIREIESEICKVPEIVSLRFS